MEKPMPPSSMSYRHLVHRNSTKDFSKKLPLRPRHNSNRRHFYRHLNWNFLKKIVLKPCFSEKLTWLTNYWTSFFNLLMQISWADFNTQWNFWPKCISLHYHYCVKTNIKFQETAICLLGVLFFSKNEKTFEILKK